MEYLRGCLGTDIDSSHIQMLEREGLLPVQNGPDKLYLRGDIDALKPLLRALIRGDVTPYGKDNLFITDLPAQVRVGSDTWLPFGEALAADNEPALRPALRHLMQLAATPMSPGESLKDARTVPWLGGTFVRTARASVARASESQFARETAIAEVGITDFARTAYYMGTKRDLAPFLVESLAGVLPEGGVVLDLMCGSGATSGAFSRVWRTYASDALEFCHCLAAIQGGGFDRQRARTCLARILQAARAHEDELRAPLASMLRREAELCHSDLTPGLLQEFCEYVSHIPTFPSERIAGVWNPYAEVKARNQELRRRPFCLFTAYFSGLYFGLRQAIEIDSLRFGIEQLDDLDERRWALGALIVAVSVQATTYAAHFAQPPLRDPAALTVPRLGKVLGRWAGSIYHEFSVRFEHLAHQSESAKYPVDIIPGPWNAALDHFSERISGIPVAVYLDAPYTREEYSRYYHVLETLVRYDYPTAKGYGKVPSKGDRFASEFFTKRRQAVEDSLVRIIKGVLEKGWICAWSYSTSGHARIASVLERIAQEDTCGIESFAAPHKYVSHRGKPRKAVTEYMYAFVPNT